MCVCIYRERDACLPRGLWFEVYSLSLVVVCSLVAACGLHFWILIPRTGIKPRYPALEGGFLTTGPSGNSLQYLTFKHGLLHNYDSVSDSHSVVSDSLRPHERQAASQGPEWGTPPVTMNYTVNGILQARILEWIAFPFSRGSSNPGIEPRSPTLQADSLPAEPQGKPHDSIKHNLN